MNRAGQFIMRDALSCDQHGTALSLSDLLRIKGLCSPTTIYSGVSNRGMVLAIKSLCSWIAGGFDPPMYGVSWSMRKAVIMAATKSSAAHSWSNFSNKELVVDCFRLSVVLDQQYWGACDPHKAMMSGRRRLQPVLTSRLLRRRQAYIGLSCFFTLLKT